LRRRRGRRRWLLPALVVGSGGVLFAVWLLARKPDAPEAAPPVDLDLSVEVLNGCGIPGAADRVAALLRRKGYRVAEVSNADHFHYRDDIVVARTVGYREALPVGKLLDGATVVEQRVEGHPVQITVVVGKPRPLVPDSDR
jgi:hypothetical protein